MGLAVRARREADAQPAGESSPPSRSDRRKALTRGRLVAAARTILIQRGTSDVSIQQITELADVGFGSFYNHFDDKPALFRQAVGDLLEEYGEHLDDLTGQLTDPAETFATNLRITARLATHSPEVARVFVEGGMHYLVQDHGLAPRARRDIERAVAAGRFTVPDTEVMLACTAGFLFSCLQSRLQDPQRTDAHTDDLVEVLLSMFGLNPDAARQVSHLALPAGTEAALRLTVAEPTGSDER